MSEQKQKGKLIEMPDTCRTCKGAGWLMDDDGQMCPDCQNPNWLGGTGRIGGKEPRQEDRPVKDETGPSDGRA